jgi:hypothetical protein
MIELAQFWMGRDRVYADQLTDGIRANAAETVRRANRLIAIYQKQTGDTRARKVSSGWRPAAVNAVTPGAARKSSHMLGRAIDIADASKAMKVWLMTDIGQKALVECELWMEHPDATPTWVHVQIVPPGSGRRVFRP